jgi:hypothetical protein
MKFIAPPTFQGRSDEDVLEWLTRYESIGVYNRWADADLHANFPMYLDGAARKWYRCLAVVPDDWPDVQPDPINAIPQALVRGLRSIFLREFQHENYTLFQEKKLRDRIQGLEEPTIGYFYDVLDLCRLVDGNMADLTKIEYLFRGLRPTLVEKIYPCRPQTCADFLALVKVYEEAANMANRRDWVSAQLPRAGAGVFTPPVVPPNATLATVAAVTTSQPEPMTEVLKVLKSLQEAQVRMQQELTQLNTKVHARRSNPPGADGNRPNNRTADGKPICNSCGKIGHVARFCRSKPVTRTEDSSVAAPPLEGATGSPTAQSARVPARIATVVLGQSTEQITGNPIAVLLVKVRATEGLVLKKVLCNKQEVEAVIDTGAAVTVISPQLAQNLACSLAAWDGPKIIMANGEEGVELGQTELTIADGDRTAEGKALVMKMKGVDLLLGNSFLRQFKNVLIQYDPEEPTAQFGENPLMMILPDIGFAPPNDRLTLRHNYRLPAHTMALVEVNGPLITTAGEWVIEPNESLFLKKGLTTGHAVVNPSSPATVPLVNFSPSEEWLEAGTTIARVVEAGIPNPVTSGPPQVNLGLVTTEADTPNRAAGDQTDDICLKATAKAQEDRHKKITSLKAAINPQLPEKEQQRTFELLSEFDDCFADNEDDLGTCHMVEHTIEVGNATPIHQRPFKSAWRERALIQQQVDRMLRQGVIEPSDSPWSSPVVLVKKKSGDWRFCVDYRKLNDVTVNDVYPLPRVEDALSRLEGAKYFSLMDLQAGYHQISVRPEDRPKTAFITADGLFQFRKMPFGLRTAPQTFQRAMDTILGRLKWWAAFAYLDDNAVYSITIPEHHERLTLALGCIRKAGFKMKPSKCHFVQTELKILGHVISAAGLSPDPGKLEAVTAFPSPNDAKSLPAKIKAVQSFVGLCSYYRRHVPNFAMVAHPLTELTKQTASFEWGTTQRQSFTALKNALSAAVTLGQPNYDQPMELHPDACGYGIGCALVQKVDGLERPLAFASRLLSKSECNYSITEKECLALVWATKKFRSFIWGNQVHVFTDHQALCWLMTKRDLAGRLARWSLTLQEFDIAIFYKSGKAHLDADCLSRYPVERPTEEEEEDRCLMVATAFSFNLRDTDSGFHEELAVAQDDDSSWKTAKETIRRGRKAGAYRLLGDRLYRQSVVGKTLLQRLCLPARYRIEVLRRYHDELTSAHLGLNRCLHQIKKRFYWPRMARFVQNYIRACQSCQARKGVADKPAGLLQCIRVMRPFQRVGMDLLGPFPLSKKGNRQIVVAIDYLTKWAEVKAMPSGTAIDVAEFFVEQIFIRHGAPEQLITDRGKCFVAEIMQAVTKLLTTNHRTTSAFNPSCNGQVERLNHVLADMLIIIIMY